MAELLIVGSLAFWLVVAAEFILLLALIEYEKAGWSFISMLVVFLGLRFLGDFDVFSLILKFPLHALAYAAGYFVAGSVWAVIKWFFYVRNRREQYIEAKEAYPNQPERTWVRDQDRGRGGETKDIPISWEESDARRRFLNSKGGLPSLARDNKNRIILWMTYWPWSGVWTIINDPIKKAFRTIYNQMQAHLQRMSDKAWEGIS